MCQLFFYSLSTPYLSFNTALWCWGQEFASYFFGFIIKRLKSGESKGRKKGETMVHPLFSSLPPSSFSLFILPVLLQVVEFHTLNFWGTVSGLMCKMLLYKVALMAGIQVEQSDANLDFLLLICLWSLFKDWLAQQQKSTYSPLCSLSPRGIRLPDRSCFISSLYILKMATLWM